MKRKILKQHLIKHYSEPGTNMILRGERKPKYEVMVELHQKHNIPFDIWLDIKSHITNDNKEASSCTTTN